MTTTPLGAARHGLVVAVEPPRMCWRYVFGGRVAHAVTGHLDRDRAACGVRPRLGAHWLGAASHGRAAMPSCPRCAGKVEHQAAVPTTFDVLGDKAAGAVA